jgi:D-alanine-D-alanine ligase
MNILLIAGGWSSEREVSLMGAANIRAALENLGHTVRDFDLAHEFDALTKQARKADFAFINMHGSPGEDGLVQAMLESAECPYQGAGPAPSFLALNKAAAKQIFRDNDIPTPDWHLLTAPLDTDTEIPLEFPVFAKPNTGGSSVDMGIARNREELVRQTGIIFSHCDQALLEQYTPGTELTCGILGETPMPVILIRPKPGAEFFDYANKYDEDGAEEICPAPIDDALSRQIMDLTLRGSKALGLTGYSRADFMLGEDGVPRMLEINTLPGMTKTSLVPRAAAAMGLSFEDLIAELIRLGLEQRGRA